MTSLLHRIPLLALCSIPAGCGSAREPVATVWYPAVTCGAH